MPHRVDDERDGMVELRFLEGLRRRRPDDTGVLRALGDLYSRLGYNQQALDADRELVGKNPDDAVAWYNLACSQALSGMVDEAFRSLVRALQLGYDDLDWMMRDSDLSSLRNDPRFEGIVERIRGNK